MGGTHVTVSLVDPPPEQLPNSNRPESVHSNDDKNHFISYPDHQDGPRMYGHPGPNMASYNRPPVRSQMDGQFGGARFPGARGGFMGNGPRGGASRPPLRARMPMDPGMMQSGGTNIGVGEGSPTPGFGAPGCVVMF